MSAAPINTTKPPADIGPLPMPALAALLSFMVPGLGQMVQGYLSGNFVRLSKGCLFLVCIWGMFFFGYAKSQWRNVYVPHVQEYYLEEDQRAGRLTNSANFMGRPMPPFAGNLWNRPQYVMQFFVGLPAWPALWNYFLPESQVFSKIQPSPGSMVIPPGNSNFPRSSAMSAIRSRRQSYPGRSGHGAAVGHLLDLHGDCRGLNIMVIYDAYAGPVRFRVVKKKPGEGK